MPNITYESKVQSLEIRCYLNMEDVLISALSIVKMLPISKQHRMAMVNLNKSKETTTTTALKLAH